MKAIFKFIFLALSMLLFIIFPCILWLEQVYIQIGILAAICILSVPMLGIKRLGMELKLLLPFVLMLLLVYLGFGLLGFSSGTNINQYSSLFLYWLIFAVNRIMLLLSTVFLIQIALSWITMQDIMNLPIGINRLKYIILGRLLYSLAMRSAEELAFHLEAIPSQQYAKKTLKKVFNKKLAHILSLLFLVIEESHISGELIDNRIRHCYKEVDK